MLTDPTILAPQNANAAFKIAPALRGSVMALGNFDGVHKGHQAVIGCAARAATAASAPLCVLSFDPHPARLFRPDLPPFAITSPAQKQALLEAFGVEGVLLLPFTRALASLSPQDFVTHVLIDALGAKHVVCGYDFTFGKDRAGKAADLAELGLAATVVHPVMASGQSLPYSSTAIRKRLSEGTPEQAAEQMGRWWQIEGVVESGDQRGRSIGFPTANLSLGDYQRPAYGVYAVRVHVAGAIYDGVANIGLRPTFDPPCELLEVHLFDFAGDLYGKRIFVDIVAFMRGERKFAGLEPLKSQIAVDRATADKILRQPGFALNRFKPVTRKDFES
jgi:riboflavin kinase / FMN adenylyltransferase